MSGVNVIPRFGPHRLNVRIARRAADAGLHAFRFDLSGLGDSLPSMSMGSFEEQAVDDVRAAMDEIQSRTGIERFLLFGICASAALSYSVALVDPRVVGCAMVDPYMYPTAKTRINRVLAHYRSDGILSLVKGWINGHVRSLGRRLGIGRPRQMPEGRDPNLDLGVRLPPKRDFANGLKRLIDRDVQLLLVHSGSVFYYYNYPKQFADGFRRFGLVGRVQADYMPSIDHTVTRLAAQELLTERLMTWIGQRFGTG